MSDTILKVEGLYKKFCSSLKRSMMYGTSDALRDFAGIRAGTDKLRKGEFWALQDINMELKRGETIGLIGQNGCGKTTLLRVINGIFPPDKGRVEINGRTGALIAVGAGFHPYMTGLENIYLNGSILGMKKEEIRRKIDEIIDFADIGNFIDAPVATYSSGMTVRLGFSVAINCSPDLLLVDEILAVGDVSFVGKCYNKISQLQENGTCIILVTHSTQALLDFCKRGLLLNNGKQILDASIGDVVKNYEMLLNQEKIAKAALKNENSLKLKDVIKSSCYMKSLSVNSDNEIEAGKPVTFCYELDSLFNLENVYISFYITTPQGLYLINIRNDLENIGVLKIKKGRNLIRITIDALNLEGGSYPCAFVLYNRNDELPVLDHAFLNPPLRISGTRRNDNLMKIKSSWEIIN